MTAAGPGDDEGPLAVGGQGAQAPAVAWTPATVRVRPSTILAVVGAVVAAIVAADVFSAAHRAVGWAFAAALLAMLLLPIEQRLDRRLPRALALVVTVLGFALVAGALWAGARHQLIEETERIKVAAPAAATSLEGRYEWAQRADLAARVDDLIAAFDPPSGGDEAERVAGTAVAYFVPGILTLFLMVYGPRMVRGALAQVPELRRTVAEPVLQATVRDVRAQVLWAALEALVVGAVVGAVAGALDLPAPVLLGLVAGLLSVLPVMGITIGSLPTVLLALALHSAAAALGVLALALGLQVVEVALVRPRVRARAGDVGPALTVVVGVLAFDLYGIGGAIYGYVGLVFVLALVRQLGLEREREDVSA